jgi:hypothetical protein
MKLKWLIIVLFLLAGFIISCKRNNDHDFFIGKLDKTKIFSRNEVLYAENIGTDELRLNIDDKWSAEVLVKSFCQLSNSGDTIRGVQFEGLHNATIHTTAFFDSVYTHIKIDTSFDSQSGKVIVKEIITRTNTKLSDEDEYCFIEQVRYASRLSYGDEIELIEFDPKDEVEIFNSGINSYKDSVAEEMGIQYIVGFKRKSILNITQKTKYFISEFPLILN